MDISIQTSKYIETNGNEEKKTYDTTYLLKTSSIDLFEADERHALIIGNGDGEDYLGPIVKEDVAIVEEFTNRHNFTSVTTLFDSNATSGRVEDFFND